MWLTKSFGLLGTLLLIVAAAFPRLSQPYFQDADARRALELFRKNQFNDAEREFARLVKTQPRHAETLQRRYLLAQSQLKAGNYTDAAISFEKLARDYPLLRDYHTLNLAKAQLGRADTTAAQTSLGQISPDVPFDGEVILLRGEAFDRQREFSSAAAEYAKYLFTYPQSWRSSEIRARLAERYEQLGRASDATAEWRKLYIDSPHDNWGAQAQRKLAANISLTADEQARRATVLFDNMRNRESELAWQAVRAASAPGSDLACRASYFLAQSIFKQRDRKRAAAPFDDAAAACKLANNSDLEVKSRYQGGRCWSAQISTQPELAEHARQLFRAIYTDYKAHSYADDAMLREAELEEGLRNESRALLLYSTIAVDFPAGDQATEAGWRRAFTAWKKGNLTEAELVLQEALKRYPHEEGWWQEGRTLYWLGRIAEKRGNLEKAQAFYQHALADYPLSFYALLASNRLSKQSPSAAATILTRFPTTGSTDWSFPDQPLFATPAFVRGLELARMGFGPDARREWQAAGIDIPRTRSAFTGTGEQENSLWLAAVLLDRAGQFALSHWIPRYLLTGYAHKWPVAENEKYWRLSYPYAYADLVEPHAKEAGLPSALVYAVMREESAFEPKTESFANAVGLMQLTQAPAKRFAQGLPFDRNALHDPAVNITIGTRELASVWSRWGKNVALAVASYNAGEGAVDKWRRAVDKSVEIDEWVERIPYDETRGYTKRVLASYFAYSYLQNGESTKIPMLPFNF